MRFSRFLSAPRLLGLATLSALALLGSCESSTSSSSGTPTGPQSITYKAELKALPGSWAIPDSIRLSIDGNAQVAKLQVDDLEVTVSIDLSAPPSDTVDIALFRTGLRYATWHFHYRGSGSLSLVGKDVDSLAVELLRRAGEGATPESIRVALVKALVETDSFLIRHPYPKNMPVGIDSAAVLREYAIRVAASGRSFTQIANSATLPVDTTTLRKLIRSLVIWGDIKDTTSIFPPPVKPRDTSVTPGDTTKPRDTTVTPGDTTKPRDTTVTPGDTTKPRDTTVTPGDTTKPRDTTVTPGDTTKPRDTTVTPGDTTKPRDTTVTPGDTTKPVAKDTVAPEIERLSFPLRVPNDSSSITLGWFASDDRGLKLVRLNQDTLPPNQNVFKRSVPLRVGDNPVVFVATDSAGNSTRDSVVISRAAADTAAPSLKRVRPTKDTTVAFETKHLDIAWIVRDDRKLGKVAINGTEIRLSGDTASLRVALALGRNVVSIIASDSSGKTTRDSVTVLRLYRDAIAPVVVAADTTTKTRTVPWWTKSLALSWKITDNDSLVSVTIDGKNIVPAGGVYSVAKALAVGANKIVVIATDTANNVRRDSVVVTRSKIDTLVASWAFTSTSAATIQDLTGNGFDLTRHADGVWSRPNTVEFTPSPTVTGKTLIKAKVWLDRYPSSRNFNGAASIAGYNEGLRLLISEHGQVIAHGQRGSEGSWAWFGLRTKAGAVPLGRWVELAVGADNSTGSMGIWIDGVAQSTYSPTTVSGTQIRIAASNPFFIGKDYVDGQPFAGKIEAVKVYSDYVLGAAKSWTVDSCITRACKLINKPVASWTVSSDTVTTLKSSYNGLDLTKKAKGFWKRPGNDTILLPTLPSGQVLYRATIKLSAYPSASTYNKQEIIMGFYAGMKLGITTRGQVFVGGQRVNGQTNKWYSVRTADNTVPLNREVTIDAGVDQTSGEFFVWIDGKRMATWTPDAIPGQKIRVATTEFALGSDASDPQKFTGELLSAAVYKAFVNGYGYNPEIDPTIDD